VNIFKTKKHKNEKIDQYPRQGRISSLTIKEADELTDCRMALLMRRPSIYTTRSSRNLLQSMEVGICVLGISSNSVEYE
jgi:hypothetical protein